MQVDLKTWALVVLAIVALLALAKWIPAARAKLAGRERGAALLLGIALAIVARLAEWAHFAPGLEGWAWTVGCGAGATLVAGVAYDKLAKPLHQLLAAASAFIWKLPPPGSGGEGEQKVG